MSRPVACPYCVKGQCYAQSDNDGCVELKCLQCSRVHPQILHLPDAMRLGMSRDDYYRFIVDDWSSMVWDDGKPAIVWDEENACVA